MIMRLYERLVFALIGTPLQRPAEGFRHLLGARQRRKHPELADVYLEDRRIRAVMERAITDGINCIDIGCHLGSVLNDMVRLSPSGRHVAFEPLPYKAAWLRRKYPRVQIHEAALGESSGVVDFYFDTRESGYSSLRAHRENEGVQKFEVQCRRLDDLIPGGLRIGFIKADVEGAELSVFRGATRVLAESKPLIVFECVRIGLANFGVQAGQVFRFFADETGYHIFLLKDWLAGNAPLDLSRFEKALEYPPQAMNFLAVPRD